METYTAKRLMASIMKIMVIFHKEEFDYFVTWVRALWILPPKAEVSQISTADPLPVWPSNHITLCLSILGDPVL